MYLSYACVSSILNILISYDDCSNNRCDCSCVATHVDDDQNLEEGARREALLDLGAANEADRHATPDLCCFTLLVGLQRNFGTGIALPWPVVIFLFF